MLTARSILILSVLLIDGALDLGQTPKDAAPARQRTRDQKPDRKQIDELMTRKLNHAQKLLAALVKNDLERAKTEAEALLRVRNEAAWLVVRTEQYETWSKEFASAAAGIIKAARDKNLDAAKLSYLELTVSCFNCHAYVRDLGDIRFSRIEP